MAAGTDPDLFAQLDLALPSTLSPGACTAILCAGTCFHRRVRIAELTLLVGEDRHEVAFDRMPRPAVAERFEGDARGHAFRSGFWAIVPARTAAPRSALRVGVEARLDDGRVATAELGEIGVADLASPVEVVPPPSSRGEGLIAICMATYDPDRELLGVQFESLRAQTDVNWVCLISDDHSRPESFAAIEAEVGDDPRFVLSRSPGRIGFYRNFERALAMVPAEATFVALADQDDRWYPDKLAALRAALGGRSVLAYSDQRRVDRDGRVIASTLWARRRRNDSDFASMLIANTVVGASVLFHRRLLDVALPFPEGPGWAFHDHWLSIVALACGELAYVDRPLYDYVQHEGAIVGKVGVEAEDHGPRPGFDRHRVRSALSRGRAVYFRVYLQLALQAATILLRAGSEMSVAKRRAAERLVAADRRNTALLWLVGRSLRELTGRNETLGTEAHLLGGLLWRRAVSAWALGARRPGRPGLETEVPPFDIEGFGQRRLKRWLAGG